MNQFPTRWQPESITIESAPDGTVAFRRDRHWDVGDVRVEYLCVPYTVAAHAEYVHQIYSRDEGLLFHCNRNRRLPVLFLWEFPQSEVRR